MFPVHTLRVTTHHEACEIHDSGYGWEDSCSTRFPHVAGGGDGEGGGWAGVGLQGNLQVRSSPPVG